MGIKVCVPIGPSKAQKVCKNKEAGTYWGPIRGTRVKKKENFKKSSSHELAVQIL